MGALPAASAQHASLSGDHDTMPSTAFVYAGPGAGLRSVLSAVHSLREALVPDVAVQQVDAATLLEGHWTEHALLLVMPGGADLPFCKHLNGEGNRIIRQGVRVVVAPWQHSLAAGSASQLTAHRLSLKRAWVEAGGCYLGLCAGAYYACARVEFEPCTK